MIDAIELPLLLKAIDFVFEEGRKILEERRERRKRQENAPQTEIQASVEEIAPPPPEEEPAEIKQELLNSKVDEILWQNHEMETQHLVRLLETYSRNYHLAREQYAKWGSALVPPIIMHNMTEAENSMLETVQKLETVLSKVYKKDIVHIK